MGMDLYDGQQFEDFDEMDLIETRMREVRFMETDLAAHLRTLGLPDVRVVIESLDDDPCILIHELLLSADEASELIRRFDPNGKACRVRGTGKGCRTVLKREGLLRPPRRSRKSFLTSPTLRDLTSPLRSYHRPLWSLRCHRISTTGSVKRWRRR